MPVNYSIPFLCPSSLTNVVAGTVYMDDIQVSLPSTAGGAVTVTVQDKQDVPVAAISVSLNPGDVQRFVFAGRVMVNGIDVISNTNAVVSTFVRWKQ